MICLKKLQKMFGVHWTYIYWETVQNVATQKWLPQKLNSTTTPLLTLISWKYNLLPLEMLLAKFGDQWTCPSLAMNAKSHHSIWVMKFWPPWNCNFILQKHPPMQRVFTARISSTKVNSIHLFVFSIARSLFRSRDFRRLLPPRFFPCDIVHNFITISTFPISSDSESIKPSLFL